MTFNWNTINNALKPIKSFQDVYRRWQESFAYQFVRDSYNFTLPELIDYTDHLLGGDTRQRYNEYKQTISINLVELQAVGVEDVLDLLELIKTQDQFKTFCEENRINPLGIVQVIKYLTYWVIPIKKYLVSLVGDNPTLREAIKPLNTMGIKSNLDILEQCCTTEGFTALGNASGLPETVISELLHRADFSRLPWASKATISNIIGAGYASLKELSNADPEILYEDFFRYGKTINKNLKLGNEIENSYRISKIIPIVLS